MSWKEVYMNQSRSFRVNSVPQDDDSLLDLERLPGPAAGWEDAVDWRGELLYVVPAEEEAAGGQHHRVEPPPSGLLRRRRSHKVASGQPRASATTSGTDLQVYSVTVRLGPEPRPGQPPWETLLGLTAAGEAPPVTITRLAPRGPLSRHHVAIGDQLERVSGVPVTRTNLATVLDTLPRRGKVRLSFRRASGCSASEIPDVNGITYPAECGREDVSAELPQNLPYAVLCLRTAGITETSPDRQDIVYQFPSEDTALLCARGSLVTLSGLTRQISGDVPLRTRITMGSATVHVAMSCEEDLVLLLAIPESSLSSWETDQLGCEIWQLLRVEFGSVRRAFCDASSRQCVDRLVGGLLCRLLLSSQSASLDRLLGASHAIHLPRHVQVLIDDSLSELECGSFGDESEDFYGLQRLFLLRGTALYYKGYLVRSHLAWEQQAAVHLYLRHHQLLARAGEQRWSQLVVWKRFHPPPAAAAGLDRAYDTDQLAHYLLVVGSKHALLAVLLETGGCTADGSGAAGPDPTYVQEAQATLSQLDSMGILDMCETWLGGSPPLSSVQDGDQSAPQHNGTARDSGGQEPGWWSRLVANRRDTGRTSRADQAQSGPTDVATQEARPDRPSDPSDLASSVSASSPSGGIVSAGCPTEDTTRPGSCAASASGSCSTEGSVADICQLYRGPPRSQQLLDHTDLEESKTMYMRQALEDSKRVVLDAFSVALQHVWLDVPTATYLALPEPLLAGWLRSDMLSAFRGSVCRLLPLLAVQELSDGVASPAAACHTAQEAGTLFRLDGLDDHTFWVVGRQMAAELRRALLFVCVLGNSPPELLQLAFRLVQGTGPR